MRHNGDSNIHGSASTKGRKDDNDDVIGHKEHISHFNQPFSQPKPMIIAQDSTMFQAKLINKRVVNKFI